MNQPENPHRLIRAGIARVLVASAALLTVSAVEPHSRYARVITMCAVLFFAHAYWITTSAKLPELVCGSRRFRLVIRLLLVTASASAVLRLRPDDGTFWNTWLLAGGAMEAVQIVVFLVYLRHVLSNLGHDRLSSHGTLLIRIASTGYALALLYTAMAVFADFENPFERLPNGEEQLRDEGIFTFLPLVGVLTALSIWNFVFLVRTYLALGGDSH
jgi:hypothetical protein